MSARFFLYRRNGTYYFRWTIPLALRQRMPDRAPSEVRLSLATMHYNDARELAARHWIAAVAVRNALLVSNSRMRYKDVLSAIRGRVCMEATPTDDESGSRTVTVVSLLGNASRDALVAGIALLNDAGAPLSAYFSGAVNIYAEDHDEDGRVVERVVERLHEWVDEAILTPAGVAAAISASGYEFPLREFISNAPGAFETSAAGKRIYYRVVPDIPAAVLLTDLRTPRKFAHVLSPLAPQSATEPVLQTPLQGAWQPRHSERLSVLVARWLERQHQSARSRAGWKDKTRKEYSAALEQCIEIVGDKQTRDLAPSDAEHYIDVISKLPRDYFKRRDVKYSGKAPSVVAKQPFPEDELLSPKTLVDKTGMVAQFFETLVGTYVEKNYFRKLYSLPSDYEPLERRDPFSDADLSAIFSGKGAELLGATLGKRNRPGVDFWGPLLGLFTGARAGEISQLSVADVMDASVPFIRITDNFVDEAAAKLKQKVKTRKSRREVPLHQVLIDFGFLDFAKMRGKSGPNAPLFPESWTRADPDRVYQRLSTKFSEHLRHVGVKTSKLSFHSFRHTVVQRFRRDSTWINQQHQFCGHDSGLPEVNTMQGKQYGTRFSVEELVPVLSQLDYPIDWETLKREAAKYRYW